MSLDPLEVGGADRRGIDVEPAAVDLEAAEVIELVEGEGQLLLGHEVEDDEFVILVAEVVERVLDRLGVVEEIADDDDESARGDALGDLVEGRGAAGVFSGNGAGELLEHGADLARLRGRTQVGADRLVEGDEPDRILLANEEVAQGRGEVAGVFEFREVRLAAEGAGRLTLVGHRARGIDDEGGAEVRLLDVLLDVIAVALAVDPPVEIAQIITGDVLAVLGELDREPLVRTRVTSVDRPHLRGARQELEAPDHVDDLGREELAELGWGRFGHAWIGGNRKLKR